MALPLNLNHKRFLVGSSHKRNPHRVWRTFIFLLLLSSFKLNLELFCQVIHLAIFNEIVSHPADAARSTYKLYTCTFSGHRAWLRTLSERVISSIAFHSNLKIIRIPQSDLPIYRDQSTWPYVNDTYKQRIDSNWKSVLFRNQNRKTMESCQSQSEQCLFPIINRGLLSSVNNYDIFFLSFFLFLSILVCLFFSLYYLFQVVVALFLLIFFVSFFCWWCQLCTVPNRYRATKSHCNHCENK